MQSIPTVISGLPGYQITYLITDNQTDIKQTQAWTFKDNKWYVITYSAQPSAYYSSATAINIINSFVLSQVGNDEYGLAQSHIILIEYFPGICVE